MQVYDGGRGVARGQYGRWSHDGHALYKQYSIKAYYAVEKLKWNELNRRHLARQHLTTIAGSVQWRPCMGVALWLVEEFASKILLEICILILTNPNSRYVLLKNTNFRYDLLTNTNSRYDLLINTNSRYDLLTNPNSRYNLLTNPNSRYDL